MTSGVRRYALCYKATDHINCRAFFASLGGGERHVGMFCPVLLLCLPTYHFLIYTKVLHIKSCFSQDKHHMAFSSLSTTLSLRKICSGPYMKNVLLHKEGELRAHIIICSNFFQLVNMFLYLCRICKVIAHSGTVYIFSSTSLFSAAVFMPFAIFSLTDTRSHSFLKIQHILLWR